MSADFALLVCCALLTAYGFWASLKNAPKSLWAKSLLAWIAALLYLAVGMQTVLLITLEGSGEILPGRMLNPGVQNYWSSLIEQGVWPQPKPWFVFFSLLAHLLAIAACRTRRTALLPLPATLFFCALFFAARSDREIFYARGVGSDETAYVVTVSEPGSAELIFCSGPDEETFLRILHRHEASGPPPQPTLRWTRDGEAVTFTTRGAPPFFALDTDGKPTGWLPSDAKDWPDRTPQRSDTREFRRKLSNVQVDVARLVKEHGGLVRSREK